MKYIAIECNGITQAMNVLQRLHFTDQAIDFKTRNQIKKDIESLFKSYLGLEETYIDDDYIWIFEECCDIFNTIVDTNVWREFEFSILNVSVISVRGDLLIEFE